MKIGIACSAGSYKGVFVQGVLAAFIEANFKATIYAASSSTAIATAYAAIGDLTLMNGPEHWKHMYSRYVANNFDVSKAIIESLPEYTEPLRGKLFQPDTPRFAVAVSAVITKEAEEMTQGQGARRLGQQLVLATRNRDRSWADKNLKCRLFESGSIDAPFKLSTKNLNDVFYATTRMLHAWKTPAWIDGLPYIDASYTCMCPAIELVAMGCTEVIAISPESGAFYRDFFGSAEIPTTYQNARIHRVQPRINLAEIGVDYMKATDEGFSIAYELGREEGKGFLGSGLLTAL